MSGGMDYRQRIFAAYRATHPSTRRPAEDLAYVFRAYEGLFGDLLPCDRRARILEIGCGGGEFLSFLRERGHEAVEGVDLDPDSVAAARESGLEVIRGDALDVLRERAGQVECIVAIDILEHFRKQELFPLGDALLAALRPGGTVIGRVPNADGLAWGAIRHGDLTHELAFTEGSAWQFFRTCGFESVDCRAELPVVTGVRSLIRRVSWVPLRWAVLAYLFVESYGHRGRLLTPNLIFRARAPGRS